VIGVLVALGFYYAPWFTHPTAAFTMNAFDLAEWSSLHPAVRSSSPPMLTSLLLRLPHVLLVAALALAANGLPDVRARWIVRGLALLLALRMVPPTDFFSGATDDGNYRQLALLTAAGLGLALGAIAAVRLAWRAQAALLIVGLVVAVVAGWMGLARAGVLLDNFEIEVATGAGPVGLSVIAAALAVAAVLWGRPPGAIKSKGD